MVRCANSKCRQELLQDWAFCPKCGSDNRHPAERRPVLDCEHMILDGEYCVLCGWSLFEDGDQTEDDALRWKVAAGWVSLIGGGIALGIGQTILMSNIEASRAAGVRAAIDRATGDAADSSSMSLAYYLVRGGGLLLIVGLFLLITSPAIKRRFGR